ncbi:hypothetical protein [Nannocystis sp. SCPEA4]|uniref:hypothetical protein n=1 Tax=Nannocystis sp. SCPEA4 TaxID=2996787 RepID=UPI002271BC79|nr:hypothetical protein [Nannocystis sp. SCPEA4]MCY1059921.1 hypothetical protein [Nannocystis sp. SCPEA4]
MRSQIVTLMAPEDEAAFLSFVFERPTVSLITDVRSPTPEIHHTRDVRGIESLDCMLWDAAILPRPQVEHIPSCDDYYLRSDESLIQFLRSPIKDTSIAVGRIALATGWKGAPATNPKTARAMTTWFNALGRWIKANFAKSFVYASDFKPDVGSREQAVWAGPRAIELSLQGWKLKHDGPPEYSLHYFDPSEEAEVLARYRAPQTLIVVGRVVHVGEVVSETLQKQVFRIALEQDAPFADFTGPFSCTRPAPKVGDEVACVFNENILGRHAEPWEPREIKKLTPANRDRVLQGLRKAWRV